MAAPEYRFAVRVYDRLTDVTLSLEDAPLFEDENDTLAAAPRVLEAFRRKQETFEGIYYPPANPPEDEQPN